MDHRPLLAAVVLSAFVGCDNRSEPVNETLPSPQASTAPAATDTAEAPATLPAESTVRIPLTAVPLTVEAPSSWAVQSGAGGKIVLHGKLTTGDVDILLSTRPDLKPEAFASLMRQITRAASQPANGIIHRVKQGETLTLTEQIERIGPEGLAPELTTYRWTVQCIVQGEKLDYHVYELNVTDASQELLDKHGDQLRAIFESLQYSPDAANPMP